jgi:hypothetical protein
MRPIIYLAFDRYVLIKTPRSDRAYCYQRILPIWTHTDVRVSFGEQVWTFSEGQWNPSEPPADLDDLYDIH